MVRVRFAPSPTGSLHLGAALTAVVNRRFADERGGVFLLRIDDTERERTAPGAEEGILADLGWLGVRWDVGPVRQSERRDAHVEAARRLLEAGDAFEEADGAVRFRCARQRPTLLRPDGRPTYHLASVVDDLELGVTHVIRGADLRPSTALHVELARALGAEPPEYLHHGLIVGEGGRKLSKRAAGSSLAGLRDLGIPAEAVRAYLEGLGFPRDDVRFDEARLRRPAADALGAAAAALLAPPRPAPTRSLETLDRFRELRAGAADDLDKEAARSLLRELKAVGGDLRALRVALTGAERGPELWAVLVALPREETLARAESAAARAK